MSGLVQKNPRTELGRFVDRLLQAFEDCRSGLSSEAVASSDDAVAGYFLELYGREAERLEAAVRTQAPHLAEGALAKLRAETDAVIRRVVVPAYVRLARGFTAKERNDFHLLPANFHALERIGFALAGMLVGGFVVWAPFIPVYEKEWIVPFMLAGLFFPNIRRYLMLRRYERELNALVARADRELARIDVAYLTDGEVIAELAEIDERARGSSLEARIAEVSKGQKEG